MAFEALKAASFLLLASTEGSPAFQVFGVALILLVWINYTSRGTLYAAAWAYTTAAARAIREQEALERARMEELTRVDLHEAAEPRPAGTGPDRALVRRRGSHGARPGRRTQAEGSRKERS